MMKELFQLDAQRIQPTSRLVEDLELDSLDAIDLAVKVEEVTGLAFDEQMLRDLRTIDDVIIAIHGLVGPNGIAALRTAAAAAQTKP